MANQMKDQELVTENRPIPSQAEGESDPDPSALNDRPVPSQAEGDLETVEEDLRQKR
jgi:hypothetical protein